MPLTVYDVFEITNSIQHSCMSTVVSFFAELLPVRNYSGLCCSNGTIVANVRGGTVEALLAPV